MKAPEKKLMLELWQDQWNALLPEKHLIERARDLRPRLEQRKYRKAFNFDESSRALYTELRYMLLILEKSKLSEPRRLTWWERITGRVQA